MLICKNTPEFYSLQDTLYFRIADYSVVSTLNSVFYIGGDISGNYALSGQIPDKYLMNIIAEYKNLTWTQLELLAVPRGRHRSLYTNNKIFIVGSGNKWVRTLLKLFLISLLLRRVAGDLIDFKDVFSELMTR